MGFSQMWSGSDMKTYFSVMLVPCSHCTNAYGLFSTTYLHQQATIQNSQLGQELHNREEPWSDEKGSADEKGSHARALHAPCINERMTGLLVADRCRLRKLPVRQGCSHRAGQVSDPLWPSSGRGFATKVGISSMSSSGCPLCNKRVKPPMSHLPAASH